MIVYWLIRVISTVYNLPRLVCYTHPRESNISDFLLSYSYKVEMSQMIRLKVNTKSTIVAKLDKPFDGRNLTWQVLVMNRQEQCTITSTRYQLLGCLYLTRSTT